MPYVSNWMATVATNRKSLKHVPTQPNLNIRQIKQEYNFAQYNYVVQYNPGYDNTAAYKAL